MSLQGRPLLAARLSDEAPKDGGSPGPGRQPGGRPKRTLIESACSACRRRKSRCDGQRPSCSRCQNLRTDCQYEAEEGESRWSALRRRNQVLEAERDQVRELLAFVQTRPEPEAMEIFNQMRRTHYDDVFILLRQFRDNAMGLSHGMPLQQQGTAAERLPPIQTILDVPGRGLTPVHPHLTHSHSLSSEDSRGSSVPDISGSLPQHRPHLDTLEPSLHPQHQQHQQHQQQQQQQQHHMMAGPISYSSEESSNSIGSTSMDAPRPYHTP